MTLKIVKDGWPWIIGPLIIAGLAGLACSYAQLPMVGYAFYALGILLALFMLYFHRNPDRVPPPDPKAIVAGADGVIRRVEKIHEDKFLKQETFRISIYLSPFNVHVNRTPMEGVIKHLSYTPGKHLLTYSNASSEYNEHSSVLIEGNEIQCLVCQIVGPIVRRVVYWLDLNQEVSKGELFGMMKFGSRLDIYVPADRVDICVEPGDTVQAGLTVVARIKSKGEPA